MNIAEVIQGLAESTIEYKGDTVSYIKVVDEKEEEDSVGIEDITREGDIVPSSKLIEFSKYQELVNERDDLKERLEKAEEQIKELEAEAD